MASSTNSHPINNLFGNYGPPINNGTYNTNNQHMMYGHQTNDIMFNNDENMFDATMKVNEN
jgi:hypothetical protein